MSSIFKFFRITFFLVLYFFLCVVVVTTVLQDWPDGGQMLFARRYRARMLFRVNYIHVLNFYF